MAADITIALPDPREKKRYHLQTTPFREVATSSLDACFHLITRSEVTGLQHLPAQGQVILAANHLTNYDVIPIQLALPRLIFFMGKEELFRNPLMDWALRQMGGFPVYRGERDDWALRHARLVLDQGQVLGIFPEGSRSKGHGLRAGKTGAARLAIESGCPVVPLAIDGPQRMFGRFPRRTPLTIHLGEPLLPRLNEGPQTFTERIMSALAGLLPPELRGIYR